MTRTSSYLPQRPPLLFALTALWVAVFLTVGVAEGQAAVRFATPQGTGHSPCLKTDPCSLFIAASNDAPAGERPQEGDEVIVEPGEYTGWQGDLGPEESISLPVNVIVHGEPGNPPLIESNKGGFVVVLNGGDTVSDLEILAPESRSPLLVLDSTAERLVVRDRGEEGIACTLGFRAVLRDSACISEGRKGAGAGERVSTNSPPFNPRTLRNVTAIGAGPESTGLLFDISDGEVFTDVKSTIAEGTATDVEAVGSDAGGGSSIILENSDFATAKAVPRNGGTASVTEPGTNGNVTAPPLLAADGYHELTGSPTIDNGVVDSLSGSLDIDGQLRTIGSAPDIGADELANPTTTTLSCQPASAAVGSKRSCLITVTDTSPSPLTPTGGATLSGSGGAVEGNCTLTPISAAASTCSSTFILNVTGTVPVTATYAGDDNHDGSEASSALAVLPAPTAGPSSIQPSPGKPPKTRLGTAPARNTTERLAKFTFFADQTGSAFQCKLDRKPYRACRSPFKAKVATGRHVFRVRAVAANGTDPTPATFRWTVLGFKG